MQIILRPSSFITLLMLCTAASQAQSVIVSPQVTDTLKLGQYKVPAGTYMSASALVAAKPSFTGRFEYTPLTDLSEGMGLNLKDKGELRLESMNGMTAEETCNKVFAICTGSELFINALTLDDNFGFHKVKNQTGPILYMEMLDRSRYSLAEVGSGGLVGYAVYGDSDNKLRKTMPLTFNYKSSQVSKINHDGMKRLLFKSPELLAELEAEKAKKSELRQVVYRRYIDRLNTIYNSK